jgi:hypothetical protein
VGCGQQLELPAQPEEARPDIPEPGTYNLKTIWNLPAPGDMAHSELYLFVIENAARIGVYYTTPTRLSAPYAPPFTAEFEGLAQPVQIAVAKRDSTFVVVADAGDMHCKIYYWLGGEPLFTFTDSLWQSFSGLAADDSLNIFVADAARDTIQAYDRWGRRRHVVSDYGTGYGYVIEPRGLAHNGQLLIVADTGKNWVQRLDPGASNVAAIAEPIGLEEDLLLSPADVAADAFGEFIYVADTGHDRVLKFLTTGAFSDTVYAPSKISLETPLLAPRYVAVRDSVTFVSDPANDRIVLLELAQGLIGS